MPEWITHNAPAIAAIAATISAIFTALYFIATLKIFREARRSADAAQVSASAAEEAAQAAKDNALAAQQSADAAQKSVDLAIQQFETQLRQGPQILNDALRSTKALIEYWSPMARVGQGNPQSVPDPAPLQASDLAHALPYARQVSRECSSRVTSIIDELKCAKSEFDRIRQSYRGPGVSPASAIGPGPSPHLERADKWIDELRVELAERHRATPNADH